MTPDAASPETTAPGGRPPKAEVEGAAAIHSDRRLPALTGLRIFAAVAVYFNHIGPPGGSPRVLETFLWSGYCGVTIFFVLSGFVLAYNYFDGMARPTGGGIYEFFVARFARIYPLYLLILLFIVLGFHNSGLSTANWWHNALGIQAWDSSLSGAFSFDSPAWSVSVEFFLYACFPLLVPLLARLRRPRSMLLTGALVAAAMLTLTAWFVLSGKGSLPIADPASAHRWLYRTPLTRLGDFTLGILAARLFVTAGLHRWSIRAGRVLAPLSVLAIVALMSWPALLISAWSWDVAYALPATVLIFSLAAAPRTLTARLLSLPAIVLLGEASYAFYLIHDPSISWLGAGIWKENGSFLIIVREAFILGAVFAFAVGLHVTVELPARKFLRGLLSTRAGSPLGRLLGRRAETSEA